MAGEMKELERRIGESARSEHPRTEINRMSFSALPSMPTSKEATSAAPQHAMLNSDLTSLKTEQAVEAPLASELSQPQAETAELHRSYQEACAQI